MSGGSADYQKWISQNEPTTDDLEKQRQIILKHQPLISIIVPVYNPLEPHLRLMVESVLNQTYSNWQLCIAEASTPTTEHKQYWTDLAQDSRVSVTYLTNNLGITGNTLEAIKQAQGEYLILMDHDDALAPDALFEVARTINSTKADLLYTDEDKIYGSSRHSPHFKPDWSPDLLCSYNYITHLLVIKRSLYDDIGGFRNGYDGAQDYDLTLRAIERADQIIHIPKVLYHWREHEGSTSLSSQAKPYVVKATTDALKNHLDRLSLSAEIEPGPFLGSSRIHFRLTSQPLISIIIPNRDSYTTLKRCIDSIRGCSTYQNFEIIIVENGSKSIDIHNYYHELESEDKINFFSWEDRFNFSAINNFGAKNSRGEILLFLNNDTEVISPSWLEEMLGFAQRKDVGVVGAKLYYPNSTIQHAGVILGLHGVAGHSHRRWSKDNFGYFGRLKVPSNVSAVTGACLMIRREVFEQVGGFDARLEVDLNDVDLCLAVRQHGYVNVWTPYAELYHYEGFTRGFSETTKFKAETAYFQQKWAKQVESGDPYYSPNLSLESDEFSVKLST